jgi:hypothetical protein
LRFLGPKTGNRRLQKIRFFLLEPNATNHGLAVGGCTLHNSPPYLIVCHRVTSSSSAGTRSRVRPADFENQFHLCLSFTAT